MSVMPEINESNPSTTLEIVSSFERSCALTLPKLYKEFLIYANGGRPKNSNFPITLCNNNSNGRIQDFLGFGAPFFMSDLEKVYGMYRNGFPHGILTIANSSGADRVVLDLRNGKQTVYYQDFVHFWGTGEWRENDLYFIASDVEAFFALLY